MPWKLYCTHFHHGRDLYSHANVVQQQWGISSDSLYGSTVLVPYHVVKSLQLVWRPAPVDGIYMYPIFKCIAVPLL